MTESTLTRRRFMRVTGGSAAGLALAGGSGSVLAQTDWTEAEAPVEETLFDAVQTSRGPFAVSAGGDALLRGPDGWEAVLERGPTVESNPLRGAGVTDDGEHAWFAGGSGVVAQYDVEEAQLTDYSAPMEKTSTWEALVVTGDAGSETVHLVNGSGEYLNGTKTDEGGMDWGEVVEPGGGSSALGIDFLDSQTGYVCDTTSQVYETTDGGESWETIGIDGASVGLTGIVARDANDLLVSGGDGTVFRYNGAVWTNLWAGGNELLAVEATDGDAVAAGAEGTIYERTTRDWKPADTGVETTLRGVSLDETGLSPGVAVGTDGTIVERDDVDGDDDVGDELEPIGDADSPPRDLDGDGLYEDIDGDGELTEDDTQTFYDYLDDPTIQENSEMFDFNGDGAVTVDLLDVQAHYQLAEEE